MTKDEAMKFALEALELVNIEFVCNGAHHAKKDRHSLDEDCPVTMRYRTAITAIKEALAQPEQEPVAWMDREGDLYKMPEIKNWAPPHTMLYTTPPQQQAEPTPWRDMVVVTLVREGINKHKARELADHFATPPQRPWVELEAEDLAQIESDEFWQTGNHMAIAMAVGAKLKERNT